MKAFNSFKTFKRFKPPLVSPALSLARKSQSNSCTGRHNTANENELRQVQSNDGKSPNGPLWQRGRAEGPGDFPLIGIFIRERKSRSPNFILP